MAVFPVNPGGPTLPLEGSPYPGVSAFREAIGTARDQSLGATYLTTKYQDNFGDQTPISQKDATAALKAQNYDTTDIPAAGMTKGALLERMNRASQTRQTQDDERRAGLGGASRFTANLAGGLGDPLNVVIAPFGGWSASAVRAGFGARVALGMAEGAGFSGANTVAADAFNKAHHLGDPDITSGDVVKNMLVGSAFGGILNGAFGPRPVAHAGGGPVTLDMIDRLGERTGAYSKMTGIPVDQVVSKTGAVGRYQVEPGTAMQYGVTKEQIDAGLLRDPTFNGKVAQRVLDDLNKRFPNDPEAVAIGYNAGPGAARKFIRAGRDYSVLAPETRAYAARVSGMPMKARYDAATAAMGQSSVDSNVNVDPVIDASLKEDFKTNPYKLQDEHDDEVTQLETEAMQGAVPRPNSVFTEDPDIQQMMRLIDVRPVEPAVDETAKLLPPGVGEAADTEPGFAKAQSSAQVDPELQQHLARDEQDAKALSGKLGTEAVYEPPAPHMIDGMPADEHQKAVEAAVRCGLVKGGF